MFPLADEPLSRAQYKKLAAEIEQKHPENFNWIRLALLSSSTTDFFNPYLTVEAARHQIGLEIWNGPYGQIEQQALDPGAGLFQAKADAVLITPELEDWCPELAWRYLELSAEDREGVANALVARMKAALESIRRHSPMRILLGSLPLPAWNACGPAAGMLQSSTLTLIQDINRRFAALCHEIDNACIIDIHGLGCQIGWNQWRDTRMALLARAPHSGAALTGLARLAARHFRSWFTPPRKCLVLDMDNTLWGGVLGESGVEGVQLGPDYPGNAFLDFQRRVLALRSRGILLAAASKNNSADVENLLARHPSCLLKREHFSAFEVHWEEKAGSLRRIAETLSIGLDSLVFFDDNPVEREWVRAQLPMVQVIDVPTSPVLYGEALEDSLAFDSFQLTEEDRKRAVFYQQEETRHKLQATASSFEEFIQSLGMTVTLGLFDEAHMPRIVQLMGKTNQFNLTTRRHDHAALLQLLQAGALGVWAKVGDRFGDSGLVALAMAVPEKDGIWVMDTFLMSCRVIGRCVETALLAAVERLVVQKGGRELHGIYAATAKNQPAADFYPRHGYQATDESGRWFHTLDETRPLPTFFTINDSNITP